MVSSWGSTGAHGNGRRLEIARLAAACCHPSLPLVLAEACPADSRPGRTDPEVVTRQRVPVLAMRLAPVRQILRVGDGLQMVGVPAGVHTATVM